MIYAKIVRIRRKKATGKRPLTPGIVCRDSELSDCGVSKRERFYLKPLFLNFTIPKPGK
jgi:hypothetical protein